MRNIGGFGMETSLLAKIFTMNPGEMAGPIKGNNSAFFVIVDEFTNPTPGEDNKIYQAQLLQNFRSKFNSNAYLNVLQDKAEIVDNRVRFF